MGEGAGLLRDGVAGALASHLEVIGMHVESIVVWNFLAVPLDALISTIILLRRSDGFFKPAAGLNGRHARDTGVGALWLGPGLLLGARFGHLVHIPCFELLCESTRAGYSHKFRGIVSNYFLTGVLSGKLATHCNSFLVVIVDCLALSARIFKLERVLGNSKLLL